MSESKLITTYKNGAHKVLVYEDHVEIGIGSMQSYRFGEIKCVKKNKGIFYDDLSLDLYSNDKCPEVWLREIDATACKLEIERKIQNYEDSNDTGPILTTFKCNVLGGSAIHLAQGQSCTAYVNQKSISFESDLPSLEIQLNHLTDLEIGGPGLVTSSAGVMGGGFGLEGAAIGMGIASILNSMTSKSKINTILRFSWAGGELFLHTSRFTPDNARIALSHVFTVMQKKGAHTQTDLASQLEKLASLRDSGALTSTEFDQAKARIIGGGA